MPLLYVHFYVYCKYYYTILLSYCRFFFHFLYYMLQVIGGVDSALYVGDLLYVPLRREWYYEVIITDITVSNVSLGLDCKEVS